MKGSEPKPSDPGRKDASFPAWLLRYAAQAAEYDDEVTELNHFEDVQTTEPSESESITGETSAD